MSSITTAVAVDYRLQQWAQLVKDCQNRPQDMTVEQWCDTKGISKSNYYYRLRCIRKHVQDNSVSCQQVVEIPEKITQQSRSESPSDISIEINGVVIHIKEDISESLLEKIIRVVSRAK